MKTIDETLSERGSRYCKFSDLSIIDQQLKEVLHSAPNWSKLKPHHKVSLEMIAHKISRILNGDPNYIENWRDISGYAAITKDILMNTDGATDSIVVGQVVKNGVLIDEKTKG